jgi:hypothetical protein
MIFDLKGISGTSIILINHSLVNGALAKTTFAQAF